MKQRVPAPVQPFFKRYTANPRGALRPLIISLLQLEVYRANFTNLHHEGMFESTRIHRKSVRAAEVLLVKVAGDDICGFDQAEVRHYWLTLLGYRISAERRLRANRLNALVQVGSERLNVPIAEAKTWCDAGLFKRYTETVLRDEWDYEGFRFRRLRDAVRT